jgi:hypothetical protein
LQAKLVHRIEETIKFTFPSSKNDQMNQGQTSLPERYRKQEEQRRR